MSPVRPVLDPSCAVRHPPAGNACGWREMVLGPGAWVHRLRPTPGLPPGEPGVKSDSRPTKPRPGAGKTAILAAIRRLAQAYSVRARSTSFATFQALVLEIG